MEEQRESKKLQYKILKHKTGKHCVIQYWLMPENHSKFSHTFIGKMYRDNRSELRYRDMLQLWQSGQASNNPTGNVGMPQPLALFSDLGMVIQEVVPGKLFVEFNAADDIRSAVALIAENLAALHGLKVSGGIQREMAWHIEKYCRPGLEKLSADYPGFTSQIDFIRDTLLNNEDLRTAPICPAHGDLGLAQIFISGNRAYFIDFDGFCLTHPALDIGNFLIALKTYHPLQFVSLKNIFIDRYRKIQGPEMLTGLNLYEGFAYLRRAMICYRKYFEADREKKIRGLLTASGDLIGEST